MPSRFVGSALISIAAILWASDALFRFPTTHVLDPVFIVFCEHLLCVLVLIPLVWWKEGHKIFKLGVREWVAAFLIGAGGSALATILFTASFKYTNPSVSILLQKIQPVLVVLFAVLFLRERPASTFYVWGGIALGAALFLGFPGFKFGFGFLEKWNTASARGVLYSVAAAGLWAIATVSGKKLLGGTSPLVASFWRFQFGFLILAALLFVSEEPVPWALLSDTNILKPLLYMGLVPGLVAMFFYYSGMKRTSASVTTCVELIFPVGAVLLNCYLLNIPLELRQILAGGVLLFAVTRISFLG